MNHDEIKSKLYEFYDAELPQDQQKEIASHIESCPACKTEIQLWKRTAEFFFKKPHVEKNEQLTEKIMASILQKEEPVEQGFAYRFDFYSLFQWKSLAALSLLLVILFYSIDKRLISQEVIQLDSVFLSANGNGHGSKINNHDQWLFSNKESGKDEFMQLVFADKGDLEEEGSFYE